MRLRGRDVAMYLNGVLVGLSTSCDFAMTCDVVEFTSALSPGRAKRYRPGRYSWQVNCDMVVDSDARLQMILEDSIILGDIVTITMDLEVPGGVARRYRGNACVQSAQLTGAVGSMAMYKVSLIGDGPLE